MYIFFLLLFSLVFCFSWAFWCYFSVGVAPIFWSLLPAWNGPVCDYSIFLMPELQLLFPFLEYPVDVCHSNDSN